MLRKTLLAAALLALPLAAQAYNFMLTNTTDSRITKVEVSEDGKDWGYFDVGKGIDAGATVQMDWDPSTDSSGCEWQVRATFADGSDAPPATFDFCEENLEIEF